MSEEWKDDEDKGSGFSGFWGHSILFGPPETPEQRAERLEQEKRTRAANELAAENISRLPPFTEAPTCPKCGCAKLRWGYGHYREAPKVHAPVFDRVGFQPYIDLSCRRCQFGDNNQNGGFIWVMAPKDAP